MSVSLHRDIRDSVRALRRQPAFALTAVLTFALAVGTTTAIFAALYPIVLRPLPFTEPDRLVIMWRHDPTRAHPVGEVSHRQYRDWRERTRSFAQLAVISSVNTSVLWSMPNGERSRIKAAAVSDTFFATLGVRPALGRAFLPEEDTRHGRPAAILSDGFWARHFGRDPSIVGRTLTFNDRPFTIVGIMPRDFAFPYGAELWHPVSPWIQASGTSYGYELLDNPTWGVLYVIGRLKPGVTQAQASHDLDAVVQTLDRESPLRPKDAGTASHVTGVITPLTGYIFGNTRAILIALAGTGAVVLLIACANLVGLLLVRAIAGRRDAAIRLALGASRGQMMRLWITESLLLASGGIIGGLLLAHGGARALVALAPTGTPRLAEVAITPPVIGFAIVIGLVSAVACALAPAWFASRPELRESLSDGARGSEGRAPRRARHALVVGQIAMAMTLLVAAGLMTRSVRNLHQLDLGYEPARVITIGVEPSRRDGPQTRAFFDQLLTRVRALPAVTSASGMSLLPLVLGPIGVDASVIFEGQTFESMEWIKNPIVNKMTVTPGYFESMGTQLLAGRTFTERDTETAPLVLIVSETAARRLWPGKSAMGQKLWLPGSPKDAAGKYPPQTVVGIVEDSRFRGIDDVRLDVFAPHHQTNDKVTTLLVRTADTTDPVDTAAAVRAVVDEIDPQAIIGRIEPLEDIVATATAPWRFAMLLFTVLSTVAFALAITGLFGLISYAVAQRTREIAVRLALGALPSQVRTLIVRQGAVLVALGIAAGLLGAAAVARALATLLFGLSPFDGPTFAAVIALIAAVAWLACHLAARRTTRIDALTLLR